mgnify:CR=1 FL=1
MINDSLNDLLNSLRSFSSKRSLVLMREHSCADPEWSYWVPPSFNSALDIKLTARIIEGKQVTVWTQGGLLAFSGGDVLHLQSNGGCSDSLECVQVVSSTPDYYADDTGFISGRVEFDVFVRPDTQSPYRAVRRDSLSQLDFVKLLIWGKYPLLT